MRALSIAATGMSAQELNVDVISNNIANLSTTAFKQQRAEFEDLLYQTITRPGITSSNTGTIVPTGIQLGLGVTTGSTYRVNTQGSLVETGNKYDIAIRGNGYFEIQTPAGDLAYSRNGSFQVNGSGELVTSDGFTVSPGITIPQGSTNIDINEDGEVFATTDGSTTPSNLGRISLATFINPAGLNAKGSGLFYETDASGSPVSGFPNDPGFGSVKQRFLELSNVDSITEITTLISAQRAYELNSKVISTGDEMLQTISQLR